MNPCPCGSESAYEQCCKPFITGNAKPATAEQLMRSRYTAYTKAKTSYIAKTSRGEALEQFDAKRAKKWAKESKWLGLQVTNTKQGDAEDTIGWVDFIATYQDKHGIHELHELSEFHKIDGMWYYVGGEHF